MTNWLGAPGAWLANLLMQTIGLGGILAGALIVFRHKADHCGKGSGANSGDRAGRAVFVGAVLFGTATLSAFPIPQGWPMRLALAGGAVISSAGYEKWI